MQYAEAMGVEGVIRSIYDAALDASRWPEFLVRFAAEFSSESATIFGQDFSDRSVDIGGGSASLTACYGVSDAAIQSFARHYCRCNVWTESEHLYREGQILNSSRIYPDRYLPQTEWHGDWLRYQDLFYSIGAVVEKRAHCSFNVTATRSKRRGSYTPDEERKLLGLMPHLQTAFAVHRRLHRVNTLANACLAVLDSLPIGMVLLDESGTVLHANSKAHVLVRSSRLLSLGMQGALNAALPRDDLWLQRAIREAVTAGGGAPLFPGSARRMHGLEGAALHVLVTPLPSWSSPFGEQAAAAVFINDPCAAMPSLEGVLRSFYQLTLAEARLADALLQGLTLQEYAHQQGLSIHTARTQFKSVAAKVGISRQADFVRTVLTGPAMMHWSAVKARLQ